jgi:GntR family transcriptional regulator
MADTTTGTVRRQDAVPLYHQIFLALRDEIVSGARAHGTILPTEHQLSDRFAVSRITARRALDELSDMGLVERRRRIGTRVIHRAAPASIDADIDQTVESLLAFGRDTAVTVLALGEVAADAVVADALGLVPGSPVLRAVRLRSKDDAPLGRIVSYTPPRFGAILTAAALTATPLLELLRGSGARIGSGSQTISALSADPELAAALALEARAAVLRVERRVQDESGAPLVLTIADYRADRYRISVDLGRISVA